MENQQREKVIDADSGETVAKVWSIELKQTGTNVAHLIVELIITNLAKDQAPTVPVISSIES